MPEPRSSHRSVLDRSGRRQDRSDRPWRVQRGGLADYDRLAVHHYRAGRPATVARWPDTPRPAVLRAVGLGREADQLAGVLLVSLPTLNGAWRERAWPGRYSTPDRRLNARRLNRELRCVSRVVVDPRWRGLGVASDLVRAYLADPITPGTEAIAAMGGAAPFFERAGMTAYPLGPSARDWRLLDAAEAAGGRDEVMLDPLRAARLAERRPALAREFRRWAGASRATRSARDAPMARLAALALPAIAIALGGRDATMSPRAYAHLADRGGAT